MVRQQSDNYGRAWRLILSSDDTSVAILEKKAIRSDIVPHGSNPAAVLYFHEKITADNSQHRGIHPLIALESHQSNVATLVAKALSFLPEASFLDSSCTSDAFLVRNGGGGVRKRKPDIVTVTRGPGMRSSLSVGLDTARGLAVAWQVPLIAINHMQAHALTPRLVSALAQDPTEPSEPAFPFLSLLVSGGHTLLVHSKALAEHEILASTLDIAIGDAIDKIARLLLPHDWLENANQSMYGSLLEKFVFPDGSTGNHYSPPATKGEQSARKQTKWGWALGVPLAETQSGSKSNNMDFSFCGLGSAVKRRVDKLGDGMSLDERKDLAREAMRVFFEHLASRVVLALDGFLHQKSSEAKLTDTLVVSGGVAANGYLRTM